MKTSASHPAASCRPTWRIHFVVGWLCLVLSTAINTAVSQPTADLEAYRDEQLLAELRSRRLFALAESLCRERLADSTAAPKSRAQWTVQLIRTLAEQALQSSGDERDGRWQTARDAAAAFYRQHPENPRGLLVRMQDALTVMARAEALRQEAEVSVDGEQSLETARSKLREAERLWDDLEDRIRDAEVLARRNSGGEQLNADELYSLQNNVQYQRVRLLRNRALCYPAASADRVAALSSALQRQQETLTRINPDDDLKWELLLDQAQCERLLDQPAAARRTLSKILDETTTPPLVRLRRRAERIRLETAEGVVVRDDQRLLLDQQINGQRAVDLDLACLEYYLSRARGGSGDWLERSADAVEQIESRYGLYWGRRAEMMLVRAAGASGTSNVNVLRRTADDLYRKGEWKDAVDAYRQAAKQALPRKPADAFDLEYKAGLVLQQHVSLLDAAEQFQAMSLAFRKDPRAAQAHLLAVWNMYQAARQQADLDDRYMLLLDEQISVWPTAAATDQARMWQGQVLEARRKWREAAAVYAEVSVDSEQLAEAARSAGRNWRRALPVLADPQRQAAATEAAAQFERWLGAEPATWTTGQLSAALETSSLYLSELPDRVQRASQLLEQIQAAAQVTPEIAREAQALAVAAQALAGKATAARQSLNQIAAGDTQPLWSVLALLEELTPASAAQRKNLAQLQLDVIARLDPASPQANAEDRLRLELLRAKALSTNGQSTAAWTAFKQLAEQHPRNGAVQLAYARWLSDQEAPEFAEAMLEQWRRVAIRVRTGTDDWFEARHGIAWGLFRQGKRQEAAQRIRYLQATQGWGPEPWPKRFQDLLTQCRQ